MRVFTEVELREKYKRAPFTTFNLPNGCKLTPAASQFLNERKIKIQIGKDLEDDSKGGSNEAEKPKINLEVEQKLGEKKPEYLTHLNAKTLVSKLHPRIKFRGKIDTVEAIIIELIIETEKMGYFKLAKDLREFLKYMGKVMRAEVLEEELPELSIGDWSDEDIHDFSHNPQKHFGIKHFMPAPEDGQVIAKLNYLRTQCREMEIVALEAFYVSPQEVTRKDILQAVNRMSSLVHVFVVGLKSGYYKIGC